MKFPPTARVMCPLCREPAYCQRTDAVNEAIADDASPETLPDVVYAGECLCGGMISLSVSTPETIDRLNAAEAAAQKVRS